MKGDSSCNHVNEELQPTSVILVGKDQHFLLDDVSLDTGCVDSSMNHSLAILEATWKEVPFALSRLSEGVSVAVSQIRCSTDIQQFIAVKDLPVLTQKHRETYIADDLEVARNNSMLSASTGDDLEQVEEGTQLTLKTEDEIKQVVDDVFNRLVNFLGLPNECNFTKSSASNGSLPFDDKQVSSMSTTQTREYRQLRSSSRLQYKDESRREKPEEFLIGGTISEITGQDEDLISEIPIEYDLETFSRHSLMEDRSTESDQVWIDHGGKDMIIDRRAVEAIMDFLAYPEKYLHLDEPKTYTQKLIASLKRRRAEMENKMTPDSKSAETTTDAMFTNVSDSHRKSNERSLSKSDGSNFEKVMDFIAFPEKHCIPRLKASLQGKNMEHRTGHTGVNQAETSCGLTKTYEERIFAEFLDQHCNIDKNSLRNNVITSATQGETTLSGEDHDGGLGLNALRRDRSLLSQCSNGTEDSSHISVRSSKSGRSFGSGMVSKRPQKNKNAVERYLALATKK